MSNEAEDLFDTISRDLPNKGVWRCKDGDKFPQKMKVFQSIRKLRSAGVDEKIIKDVVDDLYWGAYAERDAQLKERTGLMPKEIVELVDQHKAQEKANKLEQAA